MKRTLTTLSLLALVAASTACAPEATQSDADAQVTISEAAPEAVARKVAQDFTLVDEKGVSHTLHDYADASAIVVTMHGVGCPIVRKMIPTYNEIHGEYSGQNITFLMVNSNIQDSLEKILKESDEFSIAAPILKDADQAVGKSLEVVRTAETMIIDPKTWNIVYHGPLDDRLTYGLEKPVADNNFVRDVLDAVLAGETTLPHQDARQADGCIINFT